MSFENVQEKLGQLWNEGVRRRVVVDRDGKRYANLPIVIVIFVALFAFWLMAIIAVVAYIAGCRFSIEIDDDADVFLPLAHTGGPTPPSPSEDATYVPSYPEPEETAAGAEETASSVAEAAAKAVDPGDDSQSNGEARPARTLDDLG